MTALHGVGLALAYLIGAIPVGLMVGLARGVDVRKIGSGNIGATNVVRGLGASFGLLVFAVDVGKGAAGVAVCRSLGIEGWLLAMGALFAVLGHNFSPYLGFKGGKGVATSLGAMLALAPVSALIALGVWFLVVLPTRYVSLASILAAASLPFAFSLRHPAHPQMLVPVAALVIVVIGRHHENIHRLLRGEENRFGSRRESADEGREQQAQAGEH
ncbi:MAG: glycerol-3-phosphate 1-O-acyltransferase PlsY [Armatimonadota bacterium]|nr:glycerol-3-phosphate 1-O-acyltransferase PlsY [Armatimonadota bacterium]